MTGTNQSGV